MLVRSRVRRFARVALASVLFAQMAIAAAVCNMPDRSLAQVFEQDVAMPCHEAPPQNRNLCLAHCLSADQSADTPQVVVPGWSGIVTLVVAVAESSREPVIFPRGREPHAAAPPPRILFQSFLI